MGGNAVPHMCRKNYPETDRRKNLKKFIDIPHNLYHEGDFFSKGLAQNWIFCEFFSERGC